MIGTTDYLKVKRTESSVNIGEDRYHYDITQIEKCSKHLLEISNYFEMQSK